MNYHVKYGGHLLKFADKLIAMTQSFALEGLYYLRTIAGGGTVRNRILTEAMYKLWEEQGRLDNIRVAWFSEAGSVQRTSGIYRFFSKLFNLGSTEVLGPELRTGGDFESGLIGSKGDGFGSVSTWTLNTLSPISGTQDGRLIITTAFATRPLLILNPVNGLPLNKTVKFTFKYKVNSGTAIIASINELGNTTTLNTALTGSGIFEYNIRVTDTNSGTLYFGNSTCDIQIDDVSFKEVLSGATNDIVQTTANSQPYFVNGALVNPNGGSRFMTHPTVSFGAGDAWSVGMLLNWNGATNNTFTDLVNQASTGDRSFFCRDITGLYRFGLRNANYSYAGDATEYNTAKMIGKQTYVRFTHDGTGNLSYSVNGVTVSVKTGVAANAFSRIIYGQLPANSFMGKFDLYTIELGNPTEAQILEEYNLLRTFIPEISTVQVGSKHIATDNCEMVATPKGNVIALNNLAANTELITNAADREFSSDTGWWTKGSIWSISGGRANYSGTGSEELGERMLRRFPNDLLILGRLYRLRVTATVASGTLILRTQNGNLLTFLANPIILTGSNEIYFMPILNLSIGILAGGTNPSGWIDNISIEEVGFAGASDLYTAIYNQTSGTVAQKTYAALKAAAMWRSPNSSLDDQAVFGKIYNGYAAQLLKLDIDTYNTENPTTPWGYHVATLPDFQSIKDTLGGVNTAGKKLKINGVEYWTSDNGDNTSGVEVFGSGYIDESGEYREYKEATGFWTTTENGDMLEVVTMRNELDELFITE